MQSTGSKIVPLKLEKLKLKMVLSKVAGLNFFDCGEHPLECDKKEKGVGECWPKPTHGKKYWRIIKPEDVNFLLLLGKQ